MKHELSAGERIAGIDRVVETGTYVLVLSSPRSARIAIGKRLRLTLDEGCYLYVGSAFGPGGLDARLRRHQRGGGRRHWHVDYLRAATTFVGAFVDRGSLRREHQWAAELAACEPYTTIAGFGCTDCRCTTHLFHAASAPASLANLLSGEARWWRRPPRTVSARMGRSRGPVRRARTGRTAGASR